MLNCSNRANDVWIYRIECCTFATNISICLTISSFVDDSQLCCFKSHTANRLNPLKWRSGNVVTSYLREKMGRRGKLVCVMADLYSIDFPLASCPGVINIKAVGEIINLHAHRFAYFNQRRRWKQKRRLIIIGRSWAASAKSNFCYWLKRKSLERNTLVCWSPEAHNLFKIIYLQFVGGVTVTQRKCQRWKLETQSDSAPQPKKHHTLFLTAAAMSPIWSLITCQWSSL